MQWNLRARWPVWSCTERGEYSIVAVEAGGGGVVPTLSAIKYGLSKHVVFSDRFSYIEMKVCLLGEVHMIF